MIDWIQIATVVGGMLTVIVSIGTAVRWLDSRIDLLKFKKTKNIGVRCSLTSIRG